MDEYNLISLVGIFVLQAIAWAVSANRRRMNLRVIGWGVGIQFLLAAIVFLTPGSTRALRRRASTASPRTSQCPWSLWSASGGGRRMHGKRDELPSRRAPWYTQWNGIQIAFWLLWQRTEEAA